MAKSIVKLHNGAVEVVKTVDSVSWVDWVQTYYAKLIVIVSSVAALVNSITPLFTFLPGSWQHYTTAVLAGIAAVVAFLKNEQGLIDEL